MKNASILSFATFNNFLSFSFVAAFKACLLYTSICRFTVNENGEIMNIRVIKGTHPAFDKEAIRILSNFPRLIPAIDVYKRQIQLPLMTE